MCGIVGYVGKEQAAPILLDGLHKLEYRGYDSAGVVLNTGSELKVAKKKGYVSVLSDMIDGGRAIKGTIGLGHTRWATHGEPSDENAHPHLSCSGKIAVVHNGIIENYITLRETLIKKGFKFKSDTDTEVIANLVEYFYDGDILAAVSESARRMTGSFAIGIMCIDYPDMLVATRKESPLIIGLGKDCNLLASDVTAVLKYTKDVYYLDDGEIAVLRTDKVNVFGGELEPIDKELSHIEWDVSAAEKGGYEHFMFKEIVEQPDAIRKTVSPRVKDGKIIFDDITIPDSFFREMNKIYITACGSAYHVGVIAKYNLEKLIRIPVETVLASEFRYSSPLVDEKTLVICISQSGTTADTVAALREAKKLGAKVLSIVNVLGSTIANESDSVLYTWAGPEIAVATTKAYSTQLALTYLIALYFARLRGNADEEYCARIIDELINNIPDKIEKLIHDKENIQYLASQYFNNENVFFIGRNIDYALSLEGSLKLKEISYIHSEAYAAGELKHGPISLIDHGMPVFTVATYDPLIEKTMSNAVEAKSRGARIIALTTEKHENLVRKSADDVIVIPDTEEMLLGSLAIIPMQLFSYYMALMRGCNVDKPRNLAKSVTVE